MGNWDRMSRDEIRRMQDAKLAHFVQNYVYPYSPFYRDLFDKHKIKPAAIRKVSDLRRLPFTTKNDIAPTMEDPDAPRRLVLQPDEEKIREFASTGTKLQLLGKKLLLGGAAVKEELELEFRPIHVTSTTGRTALPTPFMYSRFDVDLFLKEAGRRTFQVLNLRRDQVGMSVMPYAPHLAFWFTAMAGFASNALIFQTGGGKVMGTERIITLIERMKPSYLFGIPGYVYHMLRQAAGGGRDFSSIELVGLGAERVTPGLKEKVCGFLKGMGAVDPKVTGTFGFTEAKTAWTECPTSGSTGYHLFPDMGVVEIINPDTGEPVGEGEDGEICYTCIDGRGSIVMRYRTGDFAVGGQTLEPCPGCGRTMPRLTSNITRKSNVGEFALSKVRGTLVDLNEFYPILNDDPDILEWQVEIRKKNNDPYDLDELALFVYTRSGADGAVVDRRLKEQISQRMEVTPNAITFLGENEILDRLGMESELKEKRIVDIRPRV